ncbi:hypothetical protein PPN31119_04456 [Pandoraea pnomenusa]|uniref:Uncharacterized protein n=1 Tax=Pandoraea pnomenusa TaxID=93220 RepID=A0ABY6WUP5_9BURK|nr:hypothetical protein [Pandoraea pnomenusa]VVE72954.1 hypothetical protein PPN31119_04456 [Pandoraea pnomenusa]
MYSEVEHEPFDKELFIDIVVKHMLSDVKWAIEQGRNLVAAQLLLAAVDVIAGLTRQADLEETTSAVFQAWASEHLALVGDNYKLTGADIWGARCGFLHGYTPASRIVRQGRARRLVYVDAMVPPVKSGEGPDGLVIVSLRHLYAALLTGTKATMRMIESDPELAQLVNSRLQMMFRVVDLDDEETASQ